MRGSARKKPVTIEFFKITEDNLEAVARWCNGRHKGILLRPGDQIVQIDTLEGEMTGYIGDYIIRGVKGEFYPCRGDIFEETYDIVE